jgi:cytochrome bd-type quinol oxidase subunit 2
MATRTAPREPAGPTTERTSQYARGWLVAAVLTATGWITVAVLQTPWLPLVALVALLGGYGALLVLQRSNRHADGHRQALIGAVAAAGMVLMLVGMGHHPGIGLGALAVLTASSPAVLRWVADG